MRKLAALLILAAAPAFAQTGPVDSNGRPLVNVETGAVTCAQATAANLKVDGSDVTQPVSGTVTCNAGTNLNTSALATSAAQLPDGHAVTVDNSTGASAVNIQDGGNTITVDGTVAATQSGTWNVTNVSGTVSLPTGASTAANQATVVGHVDGLEGLLTTIDADTSTLAGAVAGSEVQVDVVSSALPSGAATAALQDGIIKDGAGDTTQANVVSGRLSVDGSGVTQPVSGTVTVNLSATDNAVLDDIADGITVDLGANNDVTVTGTVTANLSATDNAVLDTIDADTSILSASVAASGAAAPANRTAVAGLTSGGTGGLLAGIPVCTQHVAVDITTATTTLLITGVAGRHVYICSLNLVTAAANNVAVIAGTGATCGTSTASLNGGVTAAEGWNFAANGGLSQGSGLGAVMSTNSTGGATGDSVCLVTSAATQLAGVIGFAVY